jgi:PAS domain S-box-containing protein
MPPERSLLRPVTDAIRNAENVDDLQDRVCDVAIEVGFESAFFANENTVYVPANSSPASTQRLVEGNGPDSVTVETATEDENHVLVPVSYDDDRFGTLVLGVERPPAEEERERLATVGDTIGHGIASIRQFQERERVEGALRQERRQVEKLHSVAAQMVSCESESGIYELAIDAAENILEFDICGIDIAEGDYLVPKATSTSMAPDDFERGPNDGGVAGKTFQESRTIIVDDVQSYENAEPTNPDYQSVLSVPVGDVGVFQAGSLEKGAFSEDDGELAELLMAHVAETLKRLRSDAALRESEEKYRTLIEQSHDAVVILQDNYYEFVNERACDLYGLDREELTAIETWNLLHEGDHEHVERVDDELLDEVGRHRTFEARIVRPDGEVRHCEFSTTSITYENEVALLSSIRDITERKEHERELERQNERLEEFASVVSHDLRSPINVVRGSVDLARETGDDEHFDRAEEALDRMEVLVEDILDLARQGKLVDETELVALDDAVTEAWNTVDAPDASLDASLDGVQVMADSMRLRELLENLFRNAVEHGGTDVTVTVDALSDGFCVADDGPGIPADQRETVFERGFSSTDEGTGFGLAIVENIGEAHGWTIEAVPSESGARFEVTGCRRSE